MKVQLNVRVDPDLRDHANQQAKAAGISLNAWVEQLIRNHRGQMKEAQALLEPVGKNGRVHVLPNEPEFELDPEVAAKAIARGDAQWLEPHGRRFDPNCRLGTHHYLYDGLEACPACHGEVE